MLEVYEDSDLPATARFKASATVGTDSYTLSYEHQDDGMSWTMVKGKLQTGQEGRYTLEELAVYCRTGDLASFVPSLDRNVLV